MDNIEVTESPVGSDGATSSPDNASPVDTQTAETPEAVSAPDGAEAGSTQYPWEADARFKGKTPEEMTQIVQEADRYKGELSQKAEAIRALEEYSGRSLSQIAEVIAEQKAEAQRQRYANNPLAPVLDEVQSLKQVVLEQQREKAQMQVDNELNEFVAKNDAYAPFRDELKQLALTPGIGFDPETHSEVSIADLAQKFFGKAIAQGQQSAYKKIEVKKNTQTTGVVSTPHKGITLDDMRKMSSRDLEIFLSKK